VLTTSLIFRIMPRERSPDLPFTVARLTHTPLPRSFRSSISSISFPCYPLPPLELSCPSFSSRFPLFSMLCRLFFQITGGGGIPHPSHQGPK
jgi:hypothetical protein